MELTVYIVILYSFREGADLPIGRGHPNSVIIHEMAFECNAYFRQIVKLYKLADGHLVSCEKHTKNGSGFWQGCTEEDSEFGAVWCKKMQHSPRCDVGITLRVYTPSIHSTVTIQSRPENVR